LTTDAQRVANVAVKAGLFPLVTDDGDVALLPSFTEDEGQADWWLLPGYLHRGVRRIALITPEIGDDGDPVLILDGVDAMCAALSAGVPA
jgi:hypothetical protein